MKIIYAGMSKCGTKTMHSGPIIKIYKNDSIILIENLKILSIRFNYINCSHFLHYEMAKVFGILGYRVCDFNETIAIDIDEWLQFYNETDPNKKKAIFKKVYEKYDVFCDVPHFTIEFINLCREIFTDVRIVWS